MPKIPQETVDLILENAQIEQVVSDYVSLKRRGASYVACCPFHNEKTPSFYVTPSKGIYKCFGCGKAGGPAQFVMEMEHCEYPDALRYLARKYHIEIQEEEETPEEIMRRQRKESLMLVSEFACKYFVEALGEGEGRSVGYNYLCGSRGLEPGTISEFNIGWAPSGRDTFVRAAMAKGFKDEYLVDAGLAVRAEDGSLRDRFRERVMFPILTPSGRVIAFSGRTLRSDNPAKYLNSPETEIYKKSDTLLGIYYAKGEISRRHECILVEGNLDMVMMYQLGIKNVVASCGTALNSSQAKLIKRFASNVVLMYDGDGAGIHAAERGIELLLAEDINVRVVLLPDGDDPDSFCRKHTLEEVESYISRNKRDFISFKTALVLQAAGKDPGRRAELISQIADQIADLIARIGDPIKRAVFIKESADKFGVEEEVIGTAVRKKHTSIGQTGISTPLATEQAQTEYVPENQILAPVEKDILELLLCYGCDILEFETDSEYYVENEDERLSVADFVRNSLDGDDARLVNSVYARIYDAYFELYDRQLLQGDILKTIYNSPDRQISDTAIKIAAADHELTIAKFRDSLTAVSSWLVKYVPYTLFLYMAKRVDNRIKVLSSSLRDSSSDVDAILKEIAELRVLKTRIYQKIGREK